MALRGSFAGRAAARREGAHSKCDECRKGDENHAGALRVIDGDGDQHVMAPNEVP